MPATAPTSATPQAPADGEPISMKDGRLRVPAKPVIPFIEGDGTGPDIWRASRRVFDAAVERAYGAGRRIAWLEVLAGEKAKDRLDSWLPDETLAAIERNLVAIKGPLTTPVGGGFRSLNVALRQKLDLYACVRPVRWFQGVPSPVKAPQDVNMVIFRENTEDIYAGIEYKAKTDEARRVIEFLQGQMGAQSIRFPATSAIGIKPVSEEGSKRLIRSAIEYAVAQKQPSVTLVHKGNIMKFTEGGFRDWGYQLAVEEYGAVEIDGGPWCRLPSGVVIKDVIADAFLQQILTRPKEYSVIATLNLNGDYISDALAAQVGGHRHRPGRQHQLPDRPRGLRGHPRHRPEVRRPGQGEPGLRHPVRRNDVPLHGLERGRRSHHQLAGADHRAEAGDLRLRAADAGSDSAEDVGVRGGDGGEHGRKSVTREKSVNGER